MLCSLVEDLFGGYVDSILILTDLATWHVISSATCVLCQQGAETVAHLFFMCPYSAEVWARVQTMLQIAPMK